MPIGPILIVDDDQDMRKALSYSLKNDGFVVDQSSNAFDALEKIKRNKYAIVITDEKMPNMTGFELLEDIKKEQPQLPVVMITAYGTVEKTVKAMKMGARDYILKPFSSNEISNIVKNHSRHIEGPSENSLTIKGEKAFEDNIIITEDKRFLNILKIAENVAPSQATILIQGESGTGKELLASFIHHKSRRENGYIAVNCAALPETLAESELFGHEKGAFTGAFKRKPGRFELANEGTIVLDEISELSLPIQAKLLRVLQEKKIDRIGGYKSLPIDFRLIAISNVDLKIAVQENNFREDLFYRLNVIPLTIPPLRERKQDILLLADHFIQKYAKLYNRCEKYLSDGAKKCLSVNKWRGNIRELENTIERAVLMSMERAEISENDLVMDSLLDAQSNSLNPSEPQSLKEMEREMIYKTLKEVNDNRTHAAERLGISIRTLRNKLNEYKEHQKGVSIMTG